ncbi:hypothetical protein CMQ_2417 [Grosmannia clavigera kw1407]|uniref:RNI-like protein n=1 Tax=Grosmannia clavigera (strain kw1407 / UAMH 11150) TaxID=655863 RepID=F0XIX6_GROCL|nr:uncharacterized protein CMQ_2417 [Grosmannia clavigera kw1407]EFX02368.1 hypothetical protein CMQ_2417 [Grosmannia clavigera kw1407]
MASISLPNLYSIYDLASTSTDASASGKRKLATLWRGIILSGVGKTAFPYCLWIRNLKLGDFEEVLRDIAPYPNLRDAFFRDGMRSFEILTKTTSSNTRPGQVHPQLDLQSISNRVGDTITSFVEEAAARSKKAVGLTHLEGHYIPMDILPTWTSRLTTLTALRIQDGSVLGEQVAASIRENCTNFRELNCFYCDGATVDKDLASFFKTLKPDSLELFGVSSKNRLGKEAFSALSLHATSLKKLHLSGLQAAAFRHLGALLPCVSLESLELEGERSSTLDWRSETSFADAVSWLSSCALLKSLKLWHVPNATTLLNLVFKSTQFHLSTLDLNLIDEDDEFYSCLGTQPTLENFMLRSIDPLPEYPSPQHAQLVESICNMRCLKVLDILQARLTPDDVNTLAVALGHLEEFGFDGDLFDDAIFDTLLKLRCLKNISFSANTVFSFDGILGYIDSLKLMELPSGEFGLVIMNQSLDAKLSTEQISFLTKHAQTSIGGRIEIEHPEEEHESDFSD